jgi:hypothetical protein
LRLPPDRRLDVLAIQRQAGAMRQLLAQLEKAGFGVTVATGLAAARAAFFGAGGVHCLVLGPDVSPGLAEQVVQSLRSVDPDLPAASFGPALRRKDAPTRTATFADFHPGSRAGAGALLRFLRALPERG